MAVTRTGVGRTGVDHGVGSSAAASPPPVLGTPTAQPITAAKYLDLDGVTQRADRYRFDVVTADLSKIGELSVGRDAGATIENRIYRRVKRTGTLTVSVDGLADVNPLTDLVRPTMILPDDTEYPMGVLRLADISTTKHAYGDMPVVTLADQNMIVDQPLAAALAVDDSVDAITQIETLISDALGTSVSVNSDLGGELGGPMSFPPGESRLTAINQIAASLGGYSLYFDNEGLPTIQSVPDADEATLSYLASLPRIAAGSIVQSTDSLDEPNRYVVISTDAGDESIVGVYDVPDDAPHSFVNIGLRKAVFLNVSGLSSASAADRRARAWGKSQSRSSYEWVQFSSPVDPRHDTFDVVQLQAVAGGPRLYYREQGWLATLTPTGTMVHDLRRSYDINGGETLVVK